MIDLSKYDFVDFGAGFGGCMDFARKKFGGRGLGIEAHQGRADTLVKKGYSCICEDVTKIKLPKKSVRYVTMSHLLEHLTDIKQVRNSIRSARDTATEFVFIEGPAFDFDKYLAKHNLKFFWSEGHGHYTKVRVRNLLSIFQKLEIRDFSFQIEQPFIIDSSSRDIHPMESPLHVAYYDRKKHPPKPKVKFDRKLYRSFIFYIWLAKNLDRKRLLASRTKFKTVDIARWT